MLTARPILIAALLALGTTACGSATESGSPPGPPASVDAAVTPKAAPWQEPDHYSYRLLSTSGERSFLGAYRITVKNGKVTEAVGLDAQAKLTVAHNLESVLTMGELLDELDTARADDAAVAHAQYAPDGHPTEIRLDWDKRAIDDEADYVITEYRSYS
ncbi:DUF6174 domain-containing protein [Streptomyces sp. 35G-GA-8]|uniref:DUF6174 domain-containing protein n=1 Tax=Streptomyces sp. 35G-GA-8 TaxID=2939434 RepID=UPI00201F94F3|nr:DUF6174 domain-containing protein [Streptomyces sp. 35G-GA-8]MCL7382475.1 DUF6174 domain-containing protein [Streptomyces sp. 35G-GA-8]